MHSEVRVLPSVSMGMFSHIPLALTTLARMVADTSLSFMGTMSAPTTNRSRIRGFNMPASISNLPFVSSEDKLRRAFKAEARSGALLLLSISTKVLDAASPARILPSVVSVIPARASAISIRTSSVPAVPRTDYVF